MFITFSHSYPKLVDGKKKLDDNGNPIIVFVYKVSGKKSECQQYLDIQMEQSGMEESSFHNEKGELLYYTVNPIPTTTGVLRISPKGKIFVETGTIDLANAMLKQYPGRLGEILAKQILSQANVKTVSEPEVAETTSIETEVDNL